MVSRFVAGMVVAGLVALGLPGAAAAGAGPTRSLLLTPDRGSELILPPSTHPEEFEGEVTSAGDVNGDGLADLLVVGSPGSGSAPYVVFGRRDGARRPATAPGGGFRIDGPAAVDAGRPRPLEGTPGITASGAGDVNGDGFSDVLVGVPNLDLPGRRNAGGAYVVFGSPSAESVQLERLGARGFRILGARKEDEAGSRVAAAGDVNGDGRGDVLLATGGGTGAAVVFSPASWHEVDLADSGAPALRIGFRRYVEIWDGLSLAGAGDVNGDGFDDVALAGAPFAGADPTTYGWVVFGRREFGRIRLEDLGARGLTVSGPTVSLVDAVAGVGDFDGDGLDDVFFGEDGDGRSRLVLGTRRGGRVDGRRSRANAVILVRGRTTEAAPAGDLNGDGRADLMLSDPSASRGCRGDTGSTWIVHGRSNTGPIDLQRLGDGGFRLDGAATLDQAGSAIAAPGDFDGDGAPDLAIAIPARLAEEGLARRPSLAIVPASPAGLAVRREPSDARCLTVRVLTQSLGDLRRTGRARFRLRVRELVPVREARGRRARFRVHATVGRTRDLEIFSAGRATVTFARPGTRTITVRLSRRDRSRLRRSPAPSRLTFVAFSLDGGVGSEWRSVRLRP